MRHVDDRILEYLDENETGSPSRMKEEGRIRYTPEYVSRRCKTLADYGLVKHLGNAVYRITEDGESYLKGELDTQELVNEGNPAEAVA